MGNQVNLMAVAFLVLAAYAPGQQFEGQPLGVTHQENRTLKFENRSGKAVVGYAVVTVFRGADGQQLLKGVTKRLELVPKADKEVWYDTVDVPANASWATSQSNVDFVQFEDGSETGPDSEHASGEVRQMRLGVNMFRHRLRDVENRLGHAAVVTELKAVQGTGPAPAALSKEERAIENGKRLESLRLLNLEQKQGGGAVSAAIARDL